MGTNGTLSLMVEKMYPKQLMLLFNNMTMVCEYTNLKGFLFHNYNTIPSIDTIGGDIILNNSTMFTMSTGERLCFNVTIVDDNEIESDEHYYFTFKAPNHSLLFYDYTQIIIRDNEGQKLYKHH